VNERPPFDPQRAAFWLIVFVIAVHAVVVLAGGVACLVYAREIILRPDLKCDPDSRLFQLLSAALAAALAFAGIRK
jgi:hypothetical protein